MAHRHSSLVSNIMVIITSSSPLRYNHHNTISNILRAFTKPSFRLSRSFPCISSQLPGLDLCCDGLVHFDYDVGDHDCDEDDVDDEDD